VAHTRPEIRESPGFDFRGRKVWSRTASLVILERKGGKKKMGEEQV